jgi:hypothetical protein
LASQSVWKKKIIVLSFILLAKETVPLFQTTQFRRSSEVGGVSRHRAPHRTFFCILSLSVEYNRWCLEHFRNTDERLISWQLWAKSTLACFRIMSYLMAIEKKCYADDKPSDFELPYFQASPLTNYKTTRNYIYVYNIYIYTYYTYTYTYTYTHIHIHIYIYIYIYRNIITIGTASLCPWKKWNRSRAPSWMIKVSTPRFSQVYGRVHFKHLHL